MLQVRPRKDQEGTCSTSQIVPRHKSFPGATMVPVQREHSFVSFYGLGCYKCCIWGHTTLLQRFWALQLLQRFWTLQLLLLGPRSAPATLQGA